MTKTKPNRRFKIKTTIRRILAFPFWIIFLPFFWLLSNGTIKDNWDNFLEFTDEDTDWGYGKI